MPDPVRAAIRELCGIPTLTPDQRAATATDDTAFRAELNTAWRRMDAARARPVPARRHA